VQSDQWRSIKEIPAQVKIAVARVHNILRKIHLYISQWSKCILSSTMWWLWNICHIPQTCYRLTFSCFRDQNVFLKDNSSQAPMKSLLEQWERWQRYRKMVSWNVSKCFMNVAKVNHYPRELLWRKCCVNRCKVTNFCIINQFQVLFDATCISVTVRQVEKKS
jgi:hypothetical protein